MNNWMQWFFVVQFFVLGSFLLKICEILGRIEKELDRLGDVQHFGRPD
jgi:hypothetical protein